MAKTSCTNSGRIIVVGGYTCSGECVNEGLLVWVGHTCFHPGAFGACMHSACAASPDPKAM